LKELDLKVDLGYNTTNTYEIATHPSTSIDPAFGILTGSSSFSSTTVKAWNVEPQIQWNKNILAGKLSILGGATFQASDGTSYTINGFGYTNDALLEDVGSAGTLTISPTVYNQYRYNAFFARLNYNYDDKYVLNLSGRRDGSSRFGPGKQFSNFGSAGAAWIFTNESFFKDHSSFLSFGKIRASYGISGNDGIPNYGYLELYQNVGPTFLGSPTLFPNNLANANYSW
ncbi:MAG TPA: hypothetical protein VKR53_05625, partial [Puia sp.]|nr:hypothetical protein [Puia sp.]